MYVYIYVCITMCTCAYRRTKIGAHNVGAHNLALQI